MSYDIPGIGRNDHTEHIDRNNRTRPHGSPNQGEYERGNYKPEYAPDSGANFQPQYAPEYHYDQANGQGYDQAYDHDYAEGIPRHTRRDSYWSRLIRDRIQQARGSPAARGSTAAWHAAERSTSGRPARRSGNEGYGSDAGLGANMNADAGTNARLLLEDLDREIWVVQNTLDKLDAHFENARVPQVEEYVQASRVLQRELYQLEARRAALQERS